MSFTFAGIFVVLVFWRPQEWLVPQIFGWPLLDIVVFTSIMGLVVDIHQGKMQFPRGPAPYMIAGLWFATVMSHVAHFYFEGMMNTIPETGKICFFALLMLCVIDRPSRARSMAIIFVTGAVLMSIHAIMQLTLGSGFQGAPPLYTEHVVTGEPVIRAIFFGIFSDPNDLAQILVAMLPFVFAVPRRITLGSIFLIVALTSLILTAFYFTHSRGGMVGILTVAVIFVLLWLPTRWMPAAALILLGGGLAVCAFQGSLLMDPSAQDRVVFWGLANGFFKEHFIFGIGYGMFWQVASDRAAHNAFVSSYTELGFFGYWFWFGLVMIGVVGCWRTRLFLAKPRNDDQRYMRRFAGVCLAAMGGFCASAYFLSRAWIFPMFFLMAILCAVPLIVEKMMVVDRPLVSTVRDVFVTNTVSAMASIFYIYLTILILNKAFYG